MALNKGANIVSAQDYYPFGGIMENRSYVTGSNVNDKYKPACRTGRFTEKERDVETGYDYFPPGRTYDSELGRWLQVDPMFEKYPGWSPYNYTLNNPLRFIDPKGMEAVEVYPDDPERKNKLHPFEKRSIGELKILTGDEFKLGSKNAVDIANDLSERSTKLVNAVDNNMPKVLDITSFVLLPFAPEASLVISYASTGWTIKNDSKTGDFNSSVISTVTSILSTISKSESVIYGVQAFQVLQNFIRPIQTDIRENLQKEIRGDNYRDQLRIYKELGNYGY
ncbi:MAG: RHS repeat-associated core domain-containing protein [Ignavibacteria bacterium]|nr:RHS repeat-associated core domain-containing protein [Ignavibacteria bacterium]